MDFSQFGFFDDNDTVVEMQHQDVSERIIPQKHINNRLYLIVLPLVNTTNTLTLLYIVSILIYLLCHAQANI